MIEATPRQSQAFRSTFELPPDLEQRVPGGRVEVTAFFPRDFGAPRVDAVYVSIPEFGSRVHGTKQFDDGAVVLDFDPKGRVMGAELTTTRRPLPELREFGRYALERSDHIAAVMIVTALDLGRRFELALVDSTATVRAVLRQLDERGISFQVDDMRIRDVVVDLVRTEPAATRWQHAELATA